MALLPGMRKAQPRRQPKAISKPFLSPTRGWVTATNLASAPEGAALVLENFVPTSTGIMMRSGCAKHATVSTVPVESVLSYVGASTRKMFAASDGKIFDVTSPVDPNIAPAPSVTGQASNYYSYVNFATSGGNFMSVVSGTDSLRLYDGAAWTTITAVSAPIAITGVATNKLSHVNVYRNRQWFVEAGTMNARYLPVDSVGGALQTVSLAGVFRNGGALLFTATWSLDAGNGPNEVIVFASTEGEYAVYQGDPADAATWGIIGLYDASPALGKNAYIRVGGDLLVLTEIGLIPMSAIKGKDPAALGLAAVSVNIHPDWQAEARSRRGLPWEIVKWTSRNIAIVSCPVVSILTPAISFAVNLETGAWSKITGWDTRCLVLHDDQVYFGTNAGLVVQADIGGSDMGALIYYTFVGHQDHLGQVGQFKTVHQARAIFRARSAFNAKLSVTTNYQLALPSYPSAAPDTTVPGEWDVGLWDQAKWDAGSSFYTVQSYWVSIGLSGFAHAPVLQIVHGATLAPTAELVIFEVTYESGALVV